MKLQAVLIAVALIAGGSAFAASDTKSSAASPAKPAAAPVHKANKAKSSKHYASTHRTKAQKSGQHAKASTQHMGASGHRKEPAVATPATDLQSRDRQNRIDQAYNDWRTGRS